VGIFEVVGGLSGPEDRNGNGDFSQGVATIAGHFSGEGSMTGVAFAAAASREPRRCGFLAMADGL
jgi:hypothetical protein